MQRNGSGLNVSWMIPSTTAETCLAVFMIHKGKKAVADDLEAVLRKIEYWHQGSIARFRISYRSIQGTEHFVEWDGKVARVL